MASLLQPSRERLQKMHEFVGVYNLSDETYKDVWNGERYEIPPRYLMRLPAQVAWLWAGDPDLRKDPKLWLKEVRRLQGRKGLGTAEFDKWLLGKKLVVDKFRNHEDGYYSVVGDQKVVVHRAETPISAKELEDPNNISALSVVSHVSEEDVFRLFEGMVSVGPKGSAEGHSTSEADDLARATAIDHGGVIRISD